MKELIPKRLYIFLAILSLLDAAVYIGFRNKTYFDFLFWNLYLAWIPLIASSLALLVYKRMKGRTGAFVLVLLGLAWLLFFPNSPYVITDLIHLTVMKQIYVVKGQSHLNHDFWHDLSVILLFAWTGLLLGAASIYQIQHIVMKLSNKLVSWCFALLASILGGYGIFLGREYRLNSWDVLRDWRQVAHIIKWSITGNSVLFSLLLGTFIGIVYITFYVLINGISKSDSI